LTTVGNSQATEEMHEYLRSWRLVAEHQSLCFYFM